MEASPLVTLKFMAEPGLPGLGDTPKLTSALQSMLLLMVQLGAGGGAGGGMLVQPGSLTHWEVEQVEPAGQVLVCCLWLALQPPAPQLPLVHTPHKESLQVGVQLPPQVEAV